MSGQTPDPQGPGFESSSLPPLFGWEARPKVEPTSDQREGALACRQMFVALTEDGQFTEKQALTIIGAMLGGQR